MNWLHFRKRCKHWSKSPVFFPFVQRIFRDFFDTPNSELATLQAIQSNKIITSIFKSNIKEGGRA